MFEIRPAYSLSNIDVFHFARTDVFLNRSVQDLTKSRELLTYFQEGLPTNWYLYQYDSRYDDSNVFIDNPEKPLYIAKVKRRGSQKDLKRAFQTGDNSRIRMEQSMGSILNELSLARTVESIVSSPRVQEMATSHGLVSAQFVSPRLGLIEKNSARKIMVYDYVEGYTPFVEEIPDYMLELNANGFFDELAEVYLSHGIVANDLALAQTIFTPKGSGYQLSLIDIEAYSRV